jgi:hypothetical protein
LSPENGLSSGVAAQLSQLHSTFVTISVPHSAYASRCGGGTGLWRMNRGRTPTVLILVPQSINRRWIRHIGSMQVHSYYALSDHNESLSLFYACADGLVCSWLTSLCCLRLNSSYAAVRQLLYYVITLSRASFSVNQHKNTTYVLPKNPSPLLPSDKTTPAKCSFSPRPPTLHLITFV